MQRIRVLVIRLFGLSRFSAFGRIEVSWLICAQAFSPNRFPGRHGCYRFGTNQLNSFSAHVAPGHPMNTTTETHDLEVITRFLLRFADLMSNGSNADNLLRAAQLLQAHVKRANDAEEQLRQERSICADLKTQVAALPRDGHVQIPVSILRLSASQFRSLADAFEKSGNVVSLAMCSASAANLERVLEANVPQATAHHAA